MLLYIIATLEIPWGTVERGSQWGGKEYESREITKGHMSYSFPVDLEYVLSSDSGTNRFPLPPALLPSPAFSVS